MLAVSGTAVGTENDAENLSACCVRHCAERDREGTYSSVEDAPQVSKQE